MLAAEILRAIFNFVVWVFVPAIALVVIFLVRSRIKKTEDEKRKSALRAGFWAGFLLFIMILIYQVGIFVVEGFPNNPIYQGFNLWLAIISGVASFFLFVSGRRIASPELAGIAVLALTFLGFYTLLDYLFIRTYNEIMLSVTLGITFGVLAYYASIPHSLRRKKHDE